MENLYDIRAKKKHLYVLSEDHSSYAPEASMLTSVAIVVNLYYENTAENYFSYLDGMPEQIAVYIISSKQTILESARNHFNGRSNIFYLQKENRGRDISALLVAFRETALQYQYICFVHDKKSKHSCLDSDAAHWIENLWKNTLASEAYVYNLLQIFERDGEIGLLVPPEPMGEYADAWYSDAWRKNFDLAWELADKLNLNCNLDRKKSPITLSTVFWAKTSAIEKLLKVEWKYEDFPDEPLPTDGTISHAIERILGYVAQDAGYITGTVMANTYAESFLLYLQNVMQDVGDFLEREHHIHTVHQVRQFDKQRKTITDFFNNNEKVFLYGAGIYGKKLLHIIRTFGLEPNGFLVTDGKCEDRLMGIPMYNLEEISPAKDTGIIVAVDYHLQEELVEILNKYGYSNYIIGYP